MTSFASFIIRKSSSSLKLNLSMVDSTAGLYYFFYIKIFCNQKVSIVLILPYVIATVELFQLLMFLGV